MARTERGSFVRRRGLVVDVHEDGIVHLKTEHGQLDLTEDEALNLLALLRNVITGDDS
jgi:hypothetical protein